MYKNWQERPYKEIKVVEKTDYITSCQAYYPNSVAVPIFTVEWLGTQAGEYNKNKDKSISKSVDGDGKRIDEVDAVPMNLILPSNFICGLYDEDTPNMIEAEGKFDAETYIGSISVLSSYLPTPRS